MSGCHGRGLALLALAPLVVSFSTSSSAGAACNGGTCLPILGPSLLQRQGAVLRRGVDTNGDELVIEWAGPSTGGAQGRKVNVTVLEARRTTGPLTLLLALHLCGGKGAPMGDVLGKMRQRGQASIHLLGSASGLEDEMLWERFLVGPLAPRDLLLVDTFGLPRTPLAGLNVSVLINGKSIEDPPRQDGQRDNGFRLSQVAGFYHKTVREVPDLAMMINPGLAHYPQTWWRTLRRLAHLEVPIVATGYGHSFGHGFALQALYSGWGGRLLRARTIRSRLAWRSPRARSDPAMPPATGAQTGECATTHSPVSASRASVCSDQDGNALVATHAGFAVHALEPNPFVFCQERGESLSCQGSEVLSVFRPQRAAVPENGAFYDKTPLALLHQILVGSLECYPLYARNRACMERRLREHPPRRKSGAYVDGFLDRVAWACED